MNLDDEYNILKFEKEVLKADEISCKLNGTETSARAFLRKACEIYIENRKYEIEQIYKNLLEQTKTKKF